MQTMIEAVVTDIEGTTTSISFVHEVLFPYARRELPRFVAEHREDPVVAGLLETTQELAQCGGSEEALVEALLSWMQEDRKVTPLKALQGMIWENGYRSGELKGHLYPDAYRYLRKWREEGIPLFVFSSGSVYAQRLLFGHTEYGDLNSWFAGNFDTTLGSKKEKGSYEGIISAVGKPGGSILFLSDVGEELDAAAAAGMKTVQLVRDRGIIPSPSHTRVTSFEQIVWPEL